MKITVCLKQTFDTEAKIKLDKNGNIDSEGVNKQINPYDEYAVEEAVRLKETHGGEITVISYGSGDCKEALRQALAMGADKAVLITDENASQADSAYTAEALAGVIKDMEFDLILAGHVAIDDGAAQVGSRLAERLDIPQVNVVTKLEINEGQAVVSRQVDGGTEVVFVKLPVMITAQRGLNEPRYPSIKGIMQAKKKELKEISIAELGLNGAPLLKTVKYTLPQGRPAGQKLEGDPRDLAEAIVKYLKEEVKAI